MFKTTFNSAPESSIPIIGRPKRKWWDQVYKDMKEIDLNVENAEDQVCWRR